MPIERNLRVACALVLGFPLPKRSRRFTSATIAVRPNILAKHQGEICEPIRLKPRAKPALADSLRQRTRKVISEENIASTSHREATLRQWLRKLRKYGVPKGIRTPVAAVKGRCPRPLDDGDAVDFLP